MLPNIQTYEPSVTVGRELVSGAFPKPKLGAKVLDDKPNFNGASILTFPLTTELEFSALIVGGEDVVDDKLAPSVTGFAAEKPNEMPEIRTFENETINIRYFTE